MLEEFWTENFKNGKLPPLIQEYKSPEGTLIFNDPTYLDDLYMSKSKFVDKHDKMQRILSHYIGESILFNKSDEMWSIKRKHLSQALYKEKLKGMLYAIMDITNNKVD